MPGRLWTIGYNVPGTSRESGQGAVSFHHDPGAESKDRTTQGTDSQNNTRNRHLRCLLGVCPKSKVQSRRRWEANIEGKTTLREATEITEGKGMRRAFSPHDGLGSVTWRVAPGWYGTRHWR
jgi:hypothetical protein